METGSKPSRLEQVEAGFARKLATIRSALKAIDFFKEFSLEDEDTGKPGFNPNNPINVEIAEHYLPHLDGILNDPDFDIISSINVSRTDVEEFAASLRDKLAKPIET